MRQHKGSAPARARSSQRRAAVGSKPKRSSALDAAATVLGALKGVEAKTGIAARDLIERMKTGKLWTSPSGKTPASTLYAAMIREIAAKGRSARFARIAPGRFVAGPGSKRHAKVTA
ncbi:MAG: HTH domain-containing protein [Planctomycetota bacterium]|nr:HTH domain-containing protein [Planctomycetota bacterium]